MIDGYRLFLGLDSLHGLSFEAVGHYCVVSGREGDKCKLELRHRTAVFHTGQHHGPLVSMPFDALLYFDPTGTLLGETDTVFGSHVQVRSVCLWRLLW